MRYLSPVEYLRSANFCQFLGIEPNWSTFHWLVVLTQHHTFHNITSFSSHASVYTMNCWVKSGIISLPAYEFSLDFVGRYLFSLTKAFKPSLDSLTGYLSDFFFPIITVFPFSSLRVVAPYRGLLKKKFFQWISRNSTSDLRILAFFWMLLGSGNPRSFCNLIGDGLINWLEMMCSTSVNRHLFAQSYIYSTWDLIRWQPKKKIWRTRPYSFALSNRLGCRLNKINKFLPIWIPRITVTIY